MTEPVRRKDPPAQVAKIATAGVSGVFVFGLTAVMGWSERSIDEPDVVPEQPPSTSAAPTPRHSSADHPAAAADDLAGSAGDDHPRRPRPRGCAGATAGGRGTGSRPSTSASRRRLGAVAVRTESQ